MGTRPKVDYETMKRALDEGGLALLSIEVQTIALAIKLILWIVHEGDHTTQHILRAKFGGLSLHKWGGGPEDFSWMMALGRTLLEEGTALFYSLCAAWLIMHKHVQPATPSNWEGKKQFLCGSPTRL